MILDHLLQCCITIIEQALLCEVGLLLLSDIVSLLLCKVESLLLNDGVFLLGIDGMLL